MVDVITQKSALREKMIAHRNGLDNDYCQKAARSLIDHLPFFDPIEGESSIAFYMPLASEIDPRPLVRELAKRFQLCLPVVCPPSKTLTFRAFHFGDALSEGQFGVLEPLEDKVEITPQILLMPLLAADENGGRLGYGGGYYDHTIEMLRQKQPVSAIGLAFEAQMVDAVPQGKFDMRLNALLTEKKIRHF